MQFKVLSLNLWNGGRLFDQMAAFLQQEQADIMLLQEAYNGTDSAWEPRFQTVTLLKQAFPTYSHHFAPTYVDTRQYEGPIEDGQLILSRWPLTETNNIFFDIPYGEYDQDRHLDFAHFPANVQIVVVTIEGQRIKLLNVHGPVNYNGTADTDRRLHMRDVIVQEVENEERVIVGGDFNVQPSTETMRSLSRVLTPVFAEGELTSTFNMKQKKNPGFATAAVDNFLVSPSLKVADRQLHSVNVSDHLPLAIILEL